MYSLQILKIADVLNGLNTEDLVSKIPIKHLILVHSTYKGLVADYVSYEVFALEALLKNFLEIFNMN